jgi:hypothetical protein
VVDDLGLGGDDRVGERVRVRDVDPVDGTLELEDVVTVLLEMADQVNTDEAPSSCDQGSHGRSS